jgi:DNA (cytosine-5)-methyltransferase 1
MFLAPAWKALQTDAMAKIKTVVLAAKADGESRTGQDEPARAAIPRLARPGRVGVPAPEQQASGAYRPSVPGEAAVRSVELFTGAGGLALGIEAAGFHHDTVVERNRHCCATIRENQSRGFPALQGWRLYEHDVREFEYASIRGEIELLAGGPPCQPFSIGGKHRGPLDKRDMFPEVARAVRELRPKAILVENVRGLLRDAFARYFESVVLQLSLPEVVSKPGEDWREHLARLERQFTKGKVNGLRYNVIFQPLNAANFGVPQKRERVIIVGFRSDLGAAWSFPTPTHSYDALLRAQWVTGEYWERHRVSRRQRPIMTPRLRTRVERVRAERTLFEGDELPWRTVRDAIADLPDPEREDCSGVLNHLHNPGARSYPGHTGSGLDEPAKTLKAGDHGVPGGENTVVFADGRVRYFTVRESARLQTFPDDFVLHGAWTEAMRQLGNAVPVQLGAAIATGIRQQLLALT